MPRRGLDWARKPPVYKRYADPVALIELPPPTTEGGMGLWEVIRRRRSRRAYSGTELRLEDLSQLLWATQGITKRREGHEFRASPSAGALYPIETYIVANHVSGLEQGIWHYQVPDHHLALIRQGDYAVQTAAAALDQPMAMHAAAVFVWTAVLERSKWKYGQRAYRYIYLDAGHIGGQLHLAAEALGLGCCAIGALYDGEVNALVGVDAENETVVYLSVVGPTR
jgi:SagB-type dehydrogenase family enzyme